MVKNTEYFVKRGVLMNKFKAWLIRKLGGCVYLEQSQKIVFKELPCITANLDIVLPPPEWNRVISENEKNKNR